MSRLVGGFWQRSLVGMRRFVAASALFFSLVFSLIMALAPGAFAADPAMATVTFSYPTDSHSVNGTEFPIVVLAHAETGEQVKLRRDHNMQVMSVPAGRYYFRQIILGFFATPTQPRPKPKNDEGFLKLPAATVAYLGDVSWSSGTGLRFGYSKNGLLALQKIDSLHSTPLVLSSFGKEPRPVSWD